MGAGQSERGPSPRRGCHAGRFQRAPRAPRGPSLLNYSKPALVTHQQSVRARGIHPKTDIVLVLSNPRKTLLYKYVYTDLTQGSNRLKWLQNTQSSIILLSQASKLALRNFYGPPNVRVTMCKLYGRNDSRSSLAQATHSHVHVTISFGSASLK